MHRLYYALYVVMSFVMCVATTHPKFAFFDFRYQGFFLVMSSIIVRFWTLGMWLLFLKVDGNMRSKPGIMISWRVKKNSGVGIRGLAETFLPSLIYLSSVYH